VRNRMIRVVSRRGRSVLSSLASSRSRSFFTLPLSDTIPFISDQLEKKGSANDHFSKLITLPAAPLVSPVVKQFLAIAPPACFFFLQTSGLKTVSLIKKAKKTGDLSPLPFVSLYTNCIVWSLYGFLQNDMTVMLPNVSGALFGLYYTYVYHKYNTGPSLAPYYFGSTAIIGGVAGAALTLDPATAATGIGLTGCTLAVILMSSPLATIKTVIKDKNTAALPFAPSFATFLNAVSWSSYGWIVAGDPMIVAPNLLGLAASLVQLSLFVKYGLPPAAPTSASTTGVPPTEANVKKENK